MTDSPDDVAAIESVLQEERLFEPPAGFSEVVGGAYVASMEQYREMYERSIRDPEGFWGEIARELDWFREWDRV
ncbi:MAG: acetyl-coenzyme A synthetase N-terminal domain-containing protein, partial [Planctomycetota bacterium]